MRRRVTFLVVILVESWAVLGSAYDLQTHDDLMLRSAQQGTAAVDGVLKNELRLVDGVLTTFPGQTTEPKPALQLMGLGARFEDEPEHRVFAHFHNPLVGWSEAGLSATVAGHVVARGPSSVLWQQNSDQDHSTVLYPKLALSPPFVTGAPRVVAGGNWSWHDARRFFLSALTGRAGQDRDEAFGRLFVGLGHLGHLLQDATVPAHVRNDPHPAPTFAGTRVPLSPDWYEDWVEGVRNDNPALYAALLDLPVVKPSMSIFTTTSSAGAPVPIARLIDTDRFLGENVDVLDTDSQAARNGEPAQLGAAEFANGNFMSRHTIFGDASPLGQAAFTRPAVSSLDLQTPFLDAYGPRVRRYFAKIRDGEPIAHFATEPIFFRSVTEAGSLPAGAAGWTLDERVHADYAASLIPRAIGYSAALLDYFFRGRLNVDLVPEPDDPSVVRVKGTNGSPDALVAGELTLYGEDADGARSVATAQGSATVTNVPPTGDLESARFQLPPETERVVAVYQGTLGHEVENPDTNVPGGVIGKVLGGTRVEQVFADGGIWRVRTPRGVFTLPLSTDEFEEVKWGDGDDIIVARTPFGDSDGGATIPNRFVSYRVARRPGSAEFTVTGSAPLEITRLRETVFPLGMPVGTTVTYNQNVQYRQRIGRVGRITSTYTWNGSAYALTATDIASPEPVLETAHSQTLSFSEQFPIVLDTFHNSDFLDSSEATDRRYIWFVGDFTADAAGRLLAVIEVRLLRPSSGAVLPFFGVDAGTGELVEQGQVVVPGAFPVGINPLLWAVVDLQTREVVASSAAGEVVVALDTGAEAPPWVASAPSAAIGLYAPVVEVFVGGERPGTGPVIWIPLELSPIEPTGPPPISTAEVSSSVGPQHVGLSGWPRPELAAALPATYQVVPAQTRTERLYLRKSETEAYSVTLATDEGRFVDHPPRLTAVRRTRPTTGTERFVILAERRGNDDVGLGHVVVWEPQQARARVVADLPVEAYRLRSASSGVALVTTSRLAPVSHVVPLDGETPSRTFEGDLSATFTVLDPTYLYNVTDFRFYRQAPLQATALPARLAPASATGGEFHAIRLP